MCCSSTSAVVMHSSSKSHECFMDASQDCTCYNMVFFSFKLPFPFLRAQKHTVPTPTFTTPIPKGMQTKQFKPSFTKVKQSLTGKFFFAFFFFIFTDRIQNDQLHSQAKGRSRCELNVENTSKHRADTDITGCFSIKNSLLMKPIYINRNKSL